RGGRRGQAAFGHVLGDDRSAAQPAGDALRRRARRRGRFADRAGAASRRRPRALRTGGGGRRDRSVPVNGPLVVVGDLLLDRGDGPGTIGGVPAPALAAVRSAGAVLVSDYGRGITSHPQLRAALTERAPRVPVVWDPHPKGAPPVGGTRLVTPNRAEAAGFVARADAAVLPNG